MKIEIALTLTISQLNWHWTFFVATLLAPELCDGGSFLKTFTFLRQPLSGPLLLLGDAYMRIVSGCLG